MTVDIAKPISILFFRVICMIKFTLRVYFLFLSEEVSFFFNAKTFSILKILAVLILSQRSCCSSSLSINLEEDHLIISLVLSYLIIMLI